MELLGVDFYTRRDASKELWRVETIASIGVAQIDVLISLHSKYNQPIEISVRGIWLQNRKMTGS